MTQPRVSENIDAWCNKCGFFLAHVIMSLNGDRPHRVKCKSCKDVHAFRMQAPGTPKKATTSSKARRTASPKTPRPTAYDKQMVDRDLAGAIPYAMNRSYQANDLIRHPKFGVGLVVRQTAADKVEVLFPDGPKQLICGR